MSRGGARFESTKLSGTKAEIESQILQAAITNSQKKGFDLYALVGEPKQNEEDDFDFTLPTGAGIQYLDLMEVAPLRGTGSHSKAAGAYVVAAMADAVWEEIKRKSEGYGSNPRSIIHLLMYSTDWRFAIDGEVAKLLGFWSLKREHCFESIALYTPFDVAEGEVVRIYPRSPEEFSSFDEISARAYVVMNADLSSLESGPAGAVEVPFVPLGKSSGKPRDINQSLAVSGGPDDSSAAIGHMASASITVPLTAYSKKQKPT